ncbi:MAG: ABC transporter ATP-binding protein [Verrucomicrobiae bacterium]|nr:ABC transporter ATP-binding protein [Verrucomicrobiae bacterium]
MKSSQSLGETGSNRKRFGSGHWGGRERHAAVIADLYPTREAFRRFWKFVRPYRKLLAIAALGNILTVCINQSIPLITKFLIDEALPSRNGTLVIGVAVVFLFATLVQNATGYGHDYLLYYSGQRTVFDIRKTLFHHLQLLHMAFYERERTASLVNRLIHDVASIQQFITTAFSTIANSAIGLCFAVTVMSFLNWKLTLLCLATLPIYFAITQAFRSRIYRMSHDVKERQSALAGSLGETFSGIKVVKSFGQEDHERRRFVLAIKDNFYPEMDLQVMGRRMWAWLALLCNTLYAGILVFGGLAVTRQDMSIGAFVAFTAYLWGLFGPIQNFSALIQVTINARTGFERILTLLDTRPEIIQDPNPVELTLKGGVEFDRVRFTYGGAPAIEDFSLDVRPGEVIALVGPSGSGKSTLMSLLTRFRDVSEGCLRIDGVDLRKLDYDCYRRQISVVLQDNFLFSGTIEENIRYGKPEATAAEVREAARLANALEFIEQAADGFRSRVGQAGVMLSGGQRQRIAIARAILKSPKILIFDEATSALDTQSEQAIQRSLDVLMQGKTVFLVAHRLSTIQKAHRIVVLQRGRIVEIGTHRELLDRKGLYSRLYQPRIVEPDARTRAA